jgi:ATPase subunit of ABC transporter with duplicated ATPase domains
MAVSLQISDLAKGFSTPLFSGVNLRAQTPVKIGLIGDNGSGKSTLLKIIAGQEQADAGSVEWSSGAKVGYLEQEIITQGFEVSGGEKKILKLTELFYSDYNVLLLDEPDNHLDLDHKNWFEQMVKDFYGLVIVISHDRHFLETGVDRIWYLDEMKIRDYPFAYGQFKEVFEGEMASRQKLWELQEKERLRLADLVKRMRVKAASNDKLTGVYHNAVHRYEKWVAEMVEKPPVRRKLSLELDLSEQHRKKTALHLKDMEKAYGDNKVLKGINLHVFCGEKVSISAPNGSGKSTLLNIIGGKIPFDGGTFRVGDGLRLGYYTQEHLDSLDDEATMIEELQKTRAFPWFEAVIYLKKFMFNENMAETKVKYLSGGQKSRLQLAKFLSLNPDILLLDEPTNHLDLRTVVALEKFLQTFEGTLILVSHDREFVENTCNVRYKLEKGKLIKDEQYGITKGFGE